MKKHVDLNFCLDCFYRETEMMVSKSGRSYEIAKCSVNGCQLKLQSRCPKNYNQNEYQLLIQKCEQYDALRYDMEMVRSQKNLTTENENVILKEVAC